MHSIAFLLTTGLKATIILAVAFLTVSMLRRSAAAARYFVWTSALIALVAMPLLTLSLQPWNVQLQASAPATFVPCRSSPTTCRIP